MSQDKTDIKKFIFSYTQFRPKMQFLMSYGGPEMQNTMAKQKTQRQNRKHNGKLQNTTALMRLKLE